MTALRAVVLTMGALVLLGWLFEYRRRAKLEVEAARHEPTGWHSPTGPSVFREGAPSSGFAGAGIGFILWIWSFVKRRRRLPQ